MNDGWRRGKAEEKIAEWSVERGSLCTDANSTEVTFEVAKKKQKKFPQLKPLAEAVEAVVHHQAAGFNPSTDGDIIAKKHGGVNGECPDSM